MTDDAPVTEPAIEQHRPFRPAWLLGAVAVLFGLFYAFDVWEAVGNWLGRAELYAYYEQALPWGWYLPPVLVPVLVFVAVLLVTRRRAIWAVAVALLVGLAAVAAVNLSFMYAGLTA